MPFDLSCGNWLRDIDHTRVKFGSLKKTIKLLETVDVENHAPAMLTRLTEFANSKSGFGSSKLRDHYYSTNSSLAATKF
ncbi:hypothetical protein HS088_TW19G00781 [Tripterygium wilfordii]|uniref:Uncharacterized protein n=1 Tax=Tripterygium wilfordii TaxID=458696 RepID=A0A7J7CBR7_TRIWF|nr:hypothetical protein HS088_TW19G00781 [Tripterygium wilfordii]